MIPIFLLFGSLTIALYVFYSRKVGSFVNAISVFTGLKIVIEFVLEPLGYLLDLFYYDFTAMFMVYLLSFVGFVAFIGGMLITKQVANPKRKIELPNYLVVSWALLFSAWLLYSPVLIEFRYLITDPRQIYEKTRIGYGLYTYGSSLLSFSAYIVFLMSTKRGSLLFYALLLVLLTLKGAKGQFFVLVAIFVIAKVYLEGFKYSLTRSAVYGLLAGVAVLYLFAFNYRGQINNIFVTIAGYSDYNRNAALVIQENAFGQYGGEIMVESLWIPKVPRAFWPQKPDVFGEFRLSSRFYPQWFALGTGAPSFGVGVYFAGFGWLAFPIVAFIYAISGYLLGRYLNKLILAPNVYYLVMSVYLSGNNLLSIGSGLYIIEHAVIGGVLVIITQILGEVNEGSQRLNLVKAEPLSEH